MLRAGLRVHCCRHSVVAVGLDHRSTIISIATNLPRLPNRGFHAEERVIFSSPKSLKTILIARISKAGLFLPIDACENCARLASKRGIRIESVSTKTIKGEKAHEQRITSQHRDGDRRKEKVQEPPQSFTR